MKWYIYLSFLHVYSVRSEIRSSIIVNKLVNIKPVGAHLAKSFIPLTEIPPPPHPTRSGASSGLPDGRRHLEDCSPPPQSWDVHEGPKVDIFGDYYEDKVGKTVATVIIPDHVDRKHFEVTNPVEYFTVGPIEAIGHHPTTYNPNECEKIYQDHLEDQYSAESADYSEESLEMARMPLTEPRIPPSEEMKLEDMYEDDWNL